jgi:hypothetical protein
LFSISQIINSPALAQWRHDVSVISEVPYVDPETGHDYEAEEPPVPVEGGALVVSVGAGAVPFTPQGQALVGDYLMICRADTQIPDDATIQVNAPTGPTYKVVDAKNFGSHQEIQLR